MRDSLMEAAAGTDEALMEKFFDEGALSDEETVRGLHVGVQEGYHHPGTVLLGRDRRGRYGACRQLHRSAAVPGGSGAYRH